MTIINLNVKGVEKLNGSLKQMERELNSAMKGMGEDIAKEVLQTQGLQQYPGLTAANTPPTPYYIRGVGMQYKSGNSGKSENLGKQWTTKHKGGMTITIGNSASYGPYVHGEEQARAMEAIGWKQLTKVAEEKIGIITRIAQAWIDRLIKKVGL